MKKDLLLKIYIVLSIVSWISLTLIDTLPLAQLGLEVEYYLLNSIRGVFISFLSVFILLYYKYSIGTSQWEKFTDLLWNILATGMLTIIINLIISLIESRVIASYITDKSALINFLNHIQLVLLLIFISKGFFVWKKMILYQKTKQRLQTWNVFEGLVYASLLFSLWEHKYSIPVIIFLVCAFTLGFILSVNVKWVAFLNFKQKWQSILFIALTLLISSLFLSQILNDLKNPFIIINLSADVYIIIIFGFLITYSLISFLVLLFNLPTSSVFQQKFEESLHFQKISQAIDINKTEKDIYEILLESSIKTVMADNGWIEWKEELKTNIIPEFITPDTVSGANYIFSKQLSAANKKPVLIDNLPEKIYDSFTGIRYSSAILIPIVIGTEIEGKMVLLKDVKDGFDKEMLSIISSFATQTGFSVENLRLLKNAVENERYKEDLEIARRVKQRLLPERKIDNPNFQFYAFSQSSDDVGGDYYDICTISNEKFGVVIADVSGHGISAAFNMAQLKGALNTLLPMHKTIKDLFAAINKTVSEILEKNAFITMSYFEIDTSLKKLFYYQAGHCPALYYQAATNQMRYIKDYGIAVGVMRNQKYANMVVPQNIVYEQGDMLMLYTDGVVEAKNMAGEEFGYERLMSFVSKNSKLSPNELAFVVKQEVELFSEGRILDDDLSIICIKF